MKNDHCIYGLREKMVSCRHLRRLALEKLNYADIAEAMEDMQEVQLKELAAA